jgi:hypothetical protein
MILFVLAVSGWGAFGMLAGWMLAGRIHRGDCLRAVRSMDEEINRVLDFDSADTIIN